MTASGSFSSSLLAHLRLSRLSAYLTETGCRFPRFRFQRRAMRITYTEEAWERFANRLFAAYERCPAAYRLLFIQRMRELNEVVECLLDTDRSDTAKVEVAGLVSR